VAAAGVMAGQTRNEAFVWKANGRGDATLAGVSEPYLTTNLTNDEERASSTLGSQTDPELPRDSVKGESGGPDDARGGQSPTSNKYLPRQAAGLYLEESMYGAPSGVVVLTERRTLWAQIQAST